MSHATKALDAWGDALPDWVRALAEEADRTSQNLVAKAIGYSAATVSNIIGNKYAADTTALENQVRASLMAETIACPEVGEMSLAHCLDWRRRAAGEFQPLGSVHRTMRRACKHCPQNGGTNDVE